MTTLRGIAGVLPCFIEGRKVRFELALGEDGEVYAISPALIDMVDAYESGLALGLEKTDLIAGNDCLLKYLSFGLPLIIICRRSALDPVILHESAALWLGEAPFCRVEARFSQTPQECQLTKEAQLFLRNYFAGLPIPKNPLHRALAVALELQGKKKFLKHIGRSGVLWLKAFEAVVDMGIQIERGRTAQVGAAALKVSQLMENSMATRPEYIFQAKQTKRAVREKQIKDALKMIDEHDAWDVDIDVD